VKALRIGVLLLTILLLASVALAQPINGPWPLERKLESTLVTGFTPATTQVIPEGCFGHGFQTWLVVYNSTDIKARYVVVASGEDFYFTVHPKEIMPHQRQTVDVKRQVDNIATEDAWYNPDVAFQVLSDTPGVYAQVSMYWDGGGHTSVGFMK
jgi:hypothetical protein